MTIDTETARPARSTSAAVKRVLITGGTGFIGSRLALRCRQLGDEVTVLAQRNTQAERDNCDELEQHGINIAEGSVTQFDVVRGATEGSDVVYHLAAAQHEANVSDRHFYDVNVEGTRNVLQASHACGVARFVHGSTIGVYGCGDDGPVNNSSPLSPDNIYGRTKLEAEQLVKQCCADLPTVTVRISETYGPGDRRLLKFFRGIQQGNFLRIGRGRNLHHLVYIDDLVESLRRAACANAAVGQTLVVAGPRAVSTDEMIDTVAKVLGVREPRLRVPLWSLMTAAVVMESALRPLGIQPPLHRRRMNFFVKSFQFCCEQSSALLSYRPSIDFEEGASRSAAWYREKHLLSSPA